MPLFLRNCRPATVFRLSVCLKSNSAMVQSNSFPFVQNRSFGTQEKLSVSKVLPFWRDNFPLVCLRQCRKKRACPVSLASLSDFPADFGRMFAMSGLAPFPTLQLASTFFPSTHRKAQRFEAVP